MSVKGFTAEIRLMTLLPLFLFAACNSVETDCVETGTCLEQSILERIDLTIIGDFDYRAQEQSPESDKSNDLVSFDVPANPGNTFIINVQLMSDHMLRIQLRDDYYGNPWEQVGAYFGTFPTQDLEDKWSYVTAQYLIGGETAAYSTNLGANLPPVADPDVLEITKSNLVEFRCLIRDLVLYKNIDPSETIEISGTMYGAATYLD